MTFRFVIWGVGATEVPPSTDHRVGRASFLFCDLELHGRAALPTPAGSGDRGGSSVSRIARTERTEVAHSKRLRRHVEKIPSQFFLPPVRELVAADAGRRRSTFGLSSSRSEEVAQQVREIARFPWSSGVSRHTFDIAHSVSP